MLRREGSESGSGVQGCRAINKGSRRWELKCLTEVWEEASVLLLIESMCVGELYALVIFVGYIHTHVIINIYIYCIGLGLGIG